MEFQASYATLPADPTANLTWPSVIRTTRTTSTIWPPATATTRFCRPTGNSACTRTARARPRETKLATKKTAAPFRGEWLSLRLEVTPTQLTWTRLDQSAKVPPKVTVIDKAYRGGYLHIGRGSTDGVLALRGLKVSTL